MTWWEKFACCFALVLWTWATWNVAAWQRKRIRERQEAQRRQELGLDGPGKGRER